MAADLSVVRAAGVADQIRAFLNQRYLEPARAEGCHEVTIRAGDVHKEMGFSNRMPAVCSVLDGKRFQNENALELIGRSGPSQGSTATAQFRLKTINRDEAAADELQIASHAPANTGFASALSYAALIHSKQLRKGTSIPYVSHLLSVSALVMEFGGKEDLAIAGLLHDALEDCGEWHEPIIRATWGERVADIVRACTDGVRGADGTKPPWRERKERYLAHLESETDEGALLVSACDKLHNARAIAADLAAGHNVFERFKEAKRDGTLWYYGELVRIFRMHFGETNQLVRQLQSAVDSMQTPIADLS